MASVGAAVGLGNVFRFPALAMKYGIIFIIFYIFFLFLLGIPLLSCEIAVGRRYGGSAVGCIKKISKKYTLIGLLACSNSFIIMTYYCLLFSFVLLCLFFSFKLLQNGGFLFADYISESGGFPFDTELFLIIAWSAVILCFGRAERLGKISAAGVIFSVFSLLFLSIKSTVANPSGLLCFLRLDTTCFFNLSFWADAASQVFFSLSVMVGVMFAFGSFLPEGDGIGKSVLTVAFFDLFISLLATVIYSSVGVEGETGLLSCFSVYPLAFSRLGGSPLFGFLFAAAFFLSLAFLCLDSVFSYLKSITASLYDSLGFSQNRSAVVLSLVSCFFGLLILSGDSFAVINRIDRFASVFLTLIIGVAESLLFGYVLTPKPLLSEINRNSSPRFSPVFFSLSLKVLCPLSLSLLFLYEIFF